MMQRKLRILLKKNKGFEERKEKRKEKLGFQR